MSNVLSLRIPKSLHEEVKELAQDEGVSLNQFIAAAVAEKVGVLRTTAEFLRERAGKARPKDLLRHVRAAPKVPPMVGDEPN